MNLHFLFLVFLGLSVTSFGFYCEAQSLTCIEAESIKVGEYVHSQTDTQLSTLTLRNQNEPPNIGQAAIKGAMARRISGELSGLPVRWSAATLIGPVLCSGSNVYKILVDPRNIRIVDGENRAVVQ
jgi:hypothetical protein